MQGGYVELSTKIIRNGKDKRFLWCKSYESQGFNLIYDENIEKNYKFVEHV